MWLKKVILLLLIVTVYSDDKCPNTCLCKWKGGKRRVECVDRGLIAIPDNIDSHTQVLNLSSNNLQILSSEIFMRSGLTNLQRISLKHCQIGQVDDDAFHSLTNVVELDLSNNLLTSVPTGIFPDIQFLRDLSLRFNPIQKIEPFAFQALHALVKLDLSNCDITSISPNAFDGLDILEYLYIDGNRLTEMRLHTVETLNSLNRLHGLAFHDNPWICNCHLRPIKEWIDTNNIPVPISPKCNGGPERLIHKKFNELKVDDFACKPEMLPVSRFVDVTVGENATLMCRANAVPPPHIRWYWNGRPLFDNSAFSAHQRIYILEEGKHEKRSTLTLTNAQENDHIDFYCVAENRAGNSEANYTLHASINTWGFLAIGNAQIVGLSSALVVLIISILIIISILLSKLRNIPFVETKTPGQIEIVAVANDSNIPNGKTAISPSDAPHETSSFSDGKVQSDNMFCNPVQKPPRLSDLPFSTAHYNGSSSLMPGSCFVSPSSINPDLINDTKQQQENDEMVPMPAPSGNNMEIDRPGSGEYSRNVDSLYPSGLWENEAFKNLNNSNFQYDDKTPIIEGQSIGSSVEELNFRLAQGTNRVIGYPPDYGLPINSTRTMSSAAHHVPLPTTAKTLRVWQKGCGPVLPPVTALKRALTNRSSPDEGYQEDCGTDV